MVVQDGGKLSNTGQPCGPHSAAAAFILDWTVYTDVYGFKKRKKKNYSSLRQGLSNDVLNKDCEAAASLGSIMEKRKSEKNWPRNVFS